MHKEFKNEQIQDKTITKINYTVSEMIRTKSFKILWIMYLLGTISGLLVIGQAKDIGVQLASLESNIAANVVGIIALFNAGGRLVWGALSDKLGRIRIVSILFVITSVSMFYMSFLPLNLVTFFLTMACVTFCFGGFLAVFPTITGEFYGIKNIGANYGIVYQAYGISALIGPIISANTGSLVTTFLIAGIVSIVGIILSIFLLKIIKLNKMSETKI
ncbi:MAG: MFS transporter [Clostridium sp.]